MTISNTCEINCKWLTFRIIKSSHKRTKIMIKIWFLSSEVFSVRSSRAYFLKRLLQTGDGVFQKCGLREPRAHSQRFGSFPAISILRISTQNTYIHKTRESEHVLCLFGLLYCIFRTNETIGLQRDDKTRHMKQGTCNMNGAKENLKFFERGTFISQLNRIKTDYNHAPEKWIKTFTD